MNASKIDAPSYGASNDASSRPADVPIEGVFGFYSVRQVESSSTQKVLRPTGAQTPPRAESFCEESEEDVFKTVEMIEVLQQERDPRLTSPEFVWFQIADTALQNENLNADIRVDVQGNSMVREEKSKELHQLLSPSRKETLENLQKHFRSYFFSTVETMRKEIGLQSGTPAHEVFQEEAEELYFKDLDSLFEDSTQGKISTSHLIQLLHCKTLQSLFALRATFASPTQVPQIHKIKKGNKEEWVIIKPAPPLENMALAGGGVRGIVYPYVLRAMKEAGTLDFIKSIAGSSAGAITGAALACGLSIEKIEELSNLPVVEALKPSEKILEQQFSSLGFFEGTRVPNLVEEEGLKTIWCFIAAQKKECSSKEELTPKEIANLDSLLKIEGELEKKPVVTFAHLAVLHQINPSQFKNLIITGYNSGTKSLEYYNAETTPEMSVAEAVRISMSLPFVFKAPLNEKGEALYDGALFGSKTPVEVFSDEQLEKTVMLEFDNKGKFNKIAHSPEKINRSVTKRISNVLASLLIGAKPGEVDNQARRKLYEKGPGALNVWHGQLGGESFFAQPEKIQQAQLQAQMRTWEWLSLRQHQAIHTVTEDLHHYFSFKNDQELAQIVTAYQPQASDSEEEASEKKEIVTAAEMILKEKAELKAKKVIVD